MTESCLQRARVARIWLVALLSAFVGKIVDAVLAPIVRRSRGRPEQAARLRTLKSLLRSVVHYALILVIGVTALDALGFHASALLAGAGVIGMAVGFGAQRLVRDVITGFFILAEDQYSVGDRIAVGAVSGTVVDIGLRITRLRARDGRLVIFANGDIASVINYSRGPLECSVDVTLPQDADLARIQETLRQLDLNLERGPILEAPAVRGISSLEPSAMAVRVTALASAGQQDEAEMLLRQKIHEALMLPLRTETVSAVPH